MGENDVLEIPLLKDKDNKNIKNSDENRFSFSFSFKVSFQFSFIKELVYNCVNHSDKLRFSFKVTKVFFTMKTMKRLRLVITEKGKSFVF